jgi:hypothetical protein
MPRKPLAPPYEFERWDGVFIEWLDSGSHEGWMPEHELPTDMPVCRTVGFFYRENETGIWVVLNHDTASDDVCGVIQIPKVAITKIRKVLLKYDKD